MPVRMYDALAKLATERRASMSTIVCESLELLLWERFGPDMSVRTEPCLDPDKMHGAADGFGGTDEGSQYDLKHPIKYPG